MIRILAIGCAIGVLCTGVASPARGAVFTAPHALVSESHGDYVEQTFRFDAAPGERNAVTLESLAAMPGRPAGYRLTDLGASVTAGTSCRAESDHTVFCTAIYPHQFMTVDLGDEADVIESDVQMAYVFGGAGDDVLGSRGNLDGGPGADHLSGSGTLNGGDGPDMLIARGSNVSLHGEDGDDTLEGGDGIDYLSGGGGRDVLHGGAGDDRLAGSADPEVIGDVLYGGAGRDIVLLTGVSSDLRVDLRILEGSQVIGSIDQVSGMEGAQTGAGDDVLYAAPGGSTLGGGGGADRLVGGSGDDVIDGGPRRDTVDAGEGDDVVDSDDGSRDLIGCGAGNDRFTGDRGDQRSGCEKVIAYELGESLNGAQPVLRRGSRIRVQYDCTDVTDDCSGDVVVSMPTPRGPRRIGSARVTCSEAPLPCSIDAHSEWIELPPFARRSLHRRGHLTLHIVSHLSGGFAAGGLRRVDTVTLTSAPAP